MALVIDDTLGGANSNSYVNLADATTYFSTQLYSDTWTNATDDDQRNRALVMATERIDKEDFLGSRGSITQSLKFPRLNLPLVDGIDFSGIIPIGLKKATYILAQYMLTTNMNQLGSKSDSIQQVKVGSIDVKFATDVNDNNSISYTTLPPDVQEYLNDFSDSVSNEIQVEWMR